MLCFSCAAHDTNDATKRQGERMSLNTIEETLRLHTPELMSISGVIGTAVSEKGGEKVILILVIVKTDALCEKLPFSLDGYPVIIDEAGEIKALDGSEN